jgi:predicted esterase
MKNGALSLALFFVGLSGAPAKPEVFDVGDHKAYIEAAPEPAEGKPWIWYAPTVKGKFILLRHKMYMDAFLNAGISVASCDLGEVRGAPGSTAKFTEFYDAMVKRGYSAKPILLGQSRGGIMTLAWAVRNPDKVTAWAGIYPVCNLASYPLRFSKNETLADYGMDEKAVREKLNELNPIENLANLANNKVPLFAVHGDKDKTVPYDENSKLLKERYEAAGGACEVKVIPGHGHDLSPAFFDCQELVDFVLKHAAKKQAGAP